ncbi:MAG: type VI secretion system protein TssA [Gemmatimonadales bacterium]|nr:MAG: type VI secretion system protein TssA [Gemmatimonadales bacterium]
MSDTLEELLQPIAGEDPGGPNLRYDPVYGEIKKAREEDPVLPQGEWKRERKVADWPEVVSLSTEVLAERSKDLQVAAWLTEGWLRTEGFTGLNRGLRLLIRLQEDFWDELHPRIEEEDDLEFRAVPLEWIGQYLEPSINSVPLNRDGHTLQEYAEAKKIGTEEEAEKDSAKQTARAEAISARKPLLEDFAESFAKTPKSFYKELAAGLENSRNTLKELDALGDERYGPVAPSYLSLRETLEGAARVADRLLAEKLETDPDPPEEEAPTDTAGSGGEAGSDTASEAAGASHPGSAGAGGAPGSAPQRIDSTDAATSAIGTAAAFLRAEDPTNPSPYLLLRGLRWGELRTAGEIDPRALEAPPTHIRTRLKGLLLDREWSKLLEAAEEVMATPYGRGWLDLQRYVVSALEGLGADYDPVIDAVGQAIRALLEVRPELPDLTLMDDSPTANRETLQWLDDHVLGVSGDDDGAAPSRRPRRERGDPTQRARDRLRAGDPHRAVELLMQAASREDSARERFLRRSEATQIMVSEGMEGVALPILQEMMDLIERHSLEEWESGDTVAQPMSLLYTSMARTGGDSGAQEELYLRICRLDPMQGMKLKGGNGGRAEPDPASDGAPSEASDGG